MGSRRSAVQQRCRSTPRRQRSMQRAWWEALPCPCMSCAALPLPLPCPAMHYALPLPLPLPLPLAPPSAPCAALCPVSPRPPPARHSLAAGHTGDVCLAHVLVRLQVRDDHLVCCCLQPLLQYREQYVEQYMVQYRVHYREQYVKKYRVQYREQYREQYVGQHRGQQDTVHSWQRRGAGRPAACMQPGACLGLIKCTSASHLHPTIHHIKHHVPNVSTPTPTPRPPTPTPSPSSTHPHTLTLARPHPSSTPPPTSRSVVVSTSSSAHAPGHVCCVNQAFAPSVIYRGVRRGMCVEQAQAAHLLMQTGQAGRLRAQRQLPASITIIHTRTRCPAPPASQPGLSRQFTGLAVRGCPQSFAPGHPSWAALTCPLGAAAAWLWPCSQTAAQSRPLQGGGGI